MSNCLLETGGGAKFRAEKAAVDCLEPLYYGLDSIMDSMPYLIA
jgi:hypothetical protein